MLILQIPRLLSLHRWCGGVLLLQLYLSFAAHSSSSTAKVCARVFARQYAVYDRLLGSLRAPGASQTHLQQGETSLFDCLLFIAGTYHLLCRRSTQDAANDGVCYRPSGRAADLLGGVLPWRHYHVAVRCEHADAWRYIAFANLEKGFSFAILNAALMDERTSMLSADVTTERVVSECLALFSRWLELTVLVHQILIGRM